MSLVRTALTKARLACEQLERALRDAAKDAKAEATAKGDGGDEDGPHTKLEAGADAAIKAQKALLDAKSWIDSAELRGWEQGGE